MFDVIGIGAASIDFVYQLPVTPVPDSARAKLHITRHLVSPGGQTATVLSTCASLGLHTKFVGTVGNDAHADVLVTALRERGVDVEGVIMRPAPTPYAVILIDEQHGERIVLWDRHPRVALTRHDLDALDLSTARVVHVDDVDPEAALEAASRAKRLHVTVTSDIEQVNSSTRALIDVVDVAILAEHVPQALTPGATLDDALRRLRTSASQWICVTLGSRGAALLAGDELFRVDGYRVPVIDTTGAGDVFRGGFIAAMLAGRAPQEVLAYANAAAAVSCTTLGAMMSVPSPQAIETLLSNAIS